MRANKFYDKQVIRIGLVFGLIGGGLMVFIRFTDFGLYFLHGYLFLINYLLTMIVGLTIYKKLAKDKSTYLKRLFTGVLIYTLTTTCFIINSSIFGKISNNRTWEDIVFTTLIIIVFGLMISSLLALIIRSRHIKR